MHGCIYARAFYTLLVFIGKFGIPPLQQFVRTIKVPPKNGFTFSIQLSFAKDICLLTDFNSNYNNKAIPPTEVIFNYPQIDFNDNWECCYHE